MNTVATLFSGGGGFDIGAKAAGYRPIWGIEYIPEIAAVYATNIGDHIIVESLLNVDPAHLERPKLLHASPPCQNASNAKGDKGETEGDRELARKVAHFISILKPKFFTLENVYFYRTFDSWKHIIAKALHNNGYSFDYWHVNSADYGVPQTRKRMIVIARRDGRKAMLPKGTHEEEPAPSLFGTAKRWDTWYDSTIDLLPTLPDDKFAPWQLERLPENLKPNTMFNGMDMKSTGRAMKGRYGDCPAATVTADDGRRPSTMPVAFIMDAANPHSNGQTKHRWGNEPVKTITSSDKLHRAFLMMGGNTGTTRARNASEPVATIVASIGKKEMPPPRLYSWPRCPHDTTLYGSVANIP